MTKENKYFDELEVINYENNILLKNKSKNLKKYKDLKKNIKLLKSGILNNLKNNNNKKKLKELVKKFKILNSKIRKQSKSTKMKLNENINRFNKLKDELIKTIDFDKPEDTSEEFLSSFSSTFDEIIKESIIEDEKYINSDIKKNNQKNIKESSNVVTENNNKVIYLILIFIILIILVFFLYFN